MKFSSYFEILQRLFIVKVQLQTEAKALICIRKRQSVTKASNTPRITIHWNITWRWSNIFELVSADRTTIKDDIKKVNFTKQLIVRNIHEIVFLLQIAAHVHWFCLQSHLSGNQMWARLYRWKMLNILKIDFIIFTTRDGIVYSVKCVRLRFVSCSIFIKHV